MVTNIQNKSYGDILSRLNEICIVKSLRQGMLAGHLCRLLSPYCSAWFILKKITPNQITLLMILFGIIGSILFIFPNPWLKLAGYVFWFLWFTMDLSDGEVARYTKQFSKYGVEMDYMAHLIDHPIMNIAFWISLIEFNTMEPFWLSLIFIVSISMELINRSLISFNHFHNINLGYSSGKKISYAKYFITQLILYPNFIIILTPIFIVDSFLKIGFSVWCYIVWFIVYSLFFIRSFTIELLKYYTSK